MLIIVILEEDFLFILYIIQISVVGLSLDWVFLVFIADMVSGTIPSSVRSGLEKICLTLFGEIW